MWSTNNLHEVLTSTRSVRLRLDLDRPVSADVIGECLQLALQAPTGGHAEDWRWMVVGDPGLKAKLGTIYRRNYEQHVLAPLQGEHGTADPKVAGRLGGLGVDGRPDARTERILAGADHLARNVGRAPWLVLACATRPLPADGGSGTWSAVFGSVYPAVWSFNLALRARGLGTTFTSLTLHSASEVADLLGTPEEVVQVCLLPVAYTVGTDFKVAKRRPVREVAYLDTWGRPFPYDDPPLAELAGGAP
ncbi:nitroreductase family protein [Nocardioides sp.]|uniref:nitroreductase family protein n=1 Tax=Nocardioides sp. TaxID=35761 RepID=UPI002732F8CA|nr:nitroreductase family protein [Nocardioides sp.]MDP3891460.1 nitroreductase family protein [Nocardioides sp.]